MWRRPEGASNCTVDKHFSESACPFLFLMDTFRQFGSQAALGEGTRTCLRILSYNLLVWTFPEEGDRSGLGLHIFWGFEEGTSFGPCTKVFIDSWRLECSLVLLLCEVSSVQTLSTSPASCILNICVGQGPRSPFPGWWTTAFHRSLEARTPRHTGSEWEAVSWGFSGGGCLILRCEIIFYAIWESHPLVAKSASLLWWQSKHLPIFCCAFFNSFTEI